MEHDNSGAGAKTPDTIFIVDDEPAVVELAAMILQPLGYKVRTFNNPNKVLEEFPAAKPALVVTDYAMGELTGLDLVRECKRINPHQKVLLMSGTVDEGIFAGEDTQPDAFLPKPFQVKELVEMVQRLTTG